MQLKELRFVLPEEYQEELIPRVYEPIERWVDDETRAAVLERVRSMHESGRIRRCTVTHSRTDHVIFVSEEIEVTIEPNDMKVWDEIRLTIAKL